MFFIKKLITFFILPPGLFISVLLIIAYLGRKVKSVFYISLASAILLYLISIEPVKDKLLQPLESSYTQPKIVDGDVIVVLGGGAYNTGILTEDSMKRLLTGFILHKRLNKPIILSGGSAISVLPEAEVMKQMLIELGVDKNMIYTDKNSRDTNENAFFVKKLCQEKGFKKIILITSAYHMKRAVYLFRFTGLDITPYPTDFKMDKKYNIYSYFPKMNVIQDSTKAIREYIGYIFYKLSLR